MRRTTSLLFISLMITMTTFHSCRKSSGDQLFTNLGKSSTGIDFRNLLVEEEDLNVINYTYFYNGAGVGVGDFNNDGLQDLVFTGNMVKNRLYINKGDMKFEDYTAKSGIAEKQGWCTGVTVADVNQDGWLDIYICRSADTRPEKRANLLFINNGNLTFTEKAAEYGLADDAYSTQAAFFDYDKDGDLDMFLLNHSLKEYNTGETLENLELKSERNPSFSSKLYRNDNNKFTDISDAAKIPGNVLSFGLGVAVSDINRDGWPDIYISNDFNEQDYYLINNGDGTFTDKLQEAFDHISLYSMGSDIADINNDGLSDLITLDMWPESNHLQKTHSGAENFDKMYRLFTSGFYFQYMRNMLQLNNGDGTFSEIGQLSGVSNTDWSWGPLLADFDNDGWKDLFISNGYVKDYTDMDFLKFSVDEVLKVRMNKAKEANVLEYLKKMPESKIQNYIYQNQGKQGDGISFVNKVKDWGLDQAGISAGGVYADLDNDGDLDLIVSNSNEYASVYQNNADKLLKNNYLKIKLKGTKSNSLGFGAKIYVYAAGQVQYQEQMPTRGYESSVDPNLVFGMGNVAAADSLVIIWPDNYRQVLKNVKANQLLTLDRQQATEKYAYQQKAVPALLHDVSGKFPFTYYENANQDLKLQTLLPHFLSRQGPCIAQGDVNGDGLEDIYIGGAKENKGALFTQTAAGTYVAKATPAIAADFICEDAGAAFFDADGDKDLDLYVVSGGYEFRPDDPMLQDRLYLNDGRGNFTKSINALPADTTSGSCVRPADIDGDGDLDLFVGGRLVPTRYPEAAASCILVNDGKGKFTDATAASCPALLKAGMVTDAAWTDLNGDRQPDLIIAGDWMPLTIFINQRGKLVDQSAQYMPAGTAGWWNKLLIEDFDDDGDMDIVAGNLGLNTQLRASAERPVELYYGDFDQNGSVDPLLCYDIQGKSYPMPSRDDLAEQLPFIKKKFNDYKSYADATIGEVLDASQLKSSKVLKATNLSSCYFENKKGKFEMHALPLQAQFAPICALAAADVNGDGHKDLLLAGNFNYVRIKFGRYDANHGMVLLGDGKGGFRYVPQPASGLNIRQEVRDMAIIKDAKGRERVLIGVNNAAMRLMEW